LFICLQDIAPRRDGVTVIVFAGQFRNRQAKAEILISAFFFLSETRVEKDRAAGRVYGVLPECCKYGNGISVSERIATEGSSDSPVCPFRERSPK
jgi:hypothetical protein